MPAKELDHCSLGYKNACCFTNDSASKWHYRTITPNLRGEIGYFYWNQNNYISIFAGLLQLPWENILRKQEGEVVFLYTFLQENCLFEIQQRPLK